MTTGRINQVTISNCIGDIHLLQTPSTDLSHQGGKLSRVGVRYEALIAPTLEVLFGLLQSYLAFHSEVYKHHTTGNRNTLSPGLTGFRYRSPCLKDRGHRLR